MNAQPIIEIQDVGKKYRIAHQRGGYLALRDVLASMIRRPLSFFARKTKDVLGIDTQEDFWALRGIDLAIHKGEIVGIIGHNGAGKSTLLKILTGITPPSEGEIIMRGRVASLLEVGTGFHPELTGRENIFLNAAILGMTTKEMHAKFDDIVAFAGVEKFLDTPVKYYSSGMYVRLAFSVAAHMEPDILLVDEVLAVGDAEFQKKSLGKMEHATRDEGRTILFVSHNLGLIQRLCKRVVWLDRGAVKMDGPAHAVINAYTQHRAEGREEVARRFSVSDGTRTGTLTVTSITITDAEGDALIRSDSRLRIAIDYESDFAQGINDVRALISIVSDRSQYTALRLDSHVTSDTLAETLPMNGTIICETDPINLAEGSYSVEILLLPQKTRDQIELSGDFEVVTDLAAYNFQRANDNNISDHLIKYRFTTS